MNYLFRGKTLTGEWVYGDLVHRHGTTCIYWKDEKGNEHRTVVLPESVGQWTGLMDKNKNKVFKGDILDVEQDEKFKVEYFEDTASFVLVGQDTSKVRWVENRDHFRDEWHININNSKIIGNITDNPELS